MSEFIQIFIGGITLSAIYLLIATGINVVFGQTRIVNFAHGQFLIIAGLASFQMTSNGVPYWFAVAIAVIGVAIAALILEVVLLRRVNTSPLASFLLTLGVLLILTQATVDRYSTLPHQLQSPIHGYLSIDGARINYASLVVIALAALTAVGLFAALKWTRFGQMVRASAEDPMASQHVGIRVTRIASATFVFGTALAAWAGCLFAMLYPLSAASGGTLLIEGFAVALLGGLGSISGGIVAALILGLAEEFATGYWAPSWVPGLRGVLIIVVLLVRPNGLFGVVQASTAQRESMLPRIVHVPGGLRWISIAAFVAAFFVPSMGLSHQLVALIAFAALYGIVAVGVGFMFRETGVLSFGHGAFWAFGAYWAALATNHWNLNSWIVMGVGTLAGAVLGGLLGIPLLRTRGFYFVIVTFAVADLAALIIQNVRGTTGGIEGLTVLRNPNGFFGIEFVSTASQLRLVLAGLALCCIATWAISRTQFGERLSAIRDNDVLARSLGMNVQAYQVLAFAVSAGIASFGGTLFLYYNAAIAPSLFDGFATVMFPLMVILGGSRSRSGPLVGSVVLTLLPFWLSFGPAGTQYAQGITLIVLMIIMPEGLVPGAVGLVDRARGWRSGPGAGGEESARLGRRLRNDKAALRRGAPTTLNPVG